MINKYGVIYFLYCFLISKLPHGKKTATGAKIEIKNIIGNNTQNAVRSGFYWGYQGLIANIINIIEKKTKKKFKIIFTGEL